MDGLVSLQPTEPAWLHAQYWVRDPATYDNQDKEILSYSHEKHKVTYFEEVVLRESGKLESRHRDFVVLDQLVFCILDTYTQTH